jgi:hypothetical protein
VDFELLLELKFEQKRELQCIPRVVGFKTVQNRASVCPSYIIRYSRGDSLGSRLLLLELSIINKLLFKTLKRKQPGRSHQSQAMIVNSGGRDCQYKKCLDFNMPRKRPRSYATKYRCEECTQEKGIDFWLCNTTMKVDGVETILDCHAKYHVERKLFITTASTTSSENSVISDLTEE